MPAGEVNEYGVAFPMDFLDLELRGKGSLLQCSQSDVTPDPKLRLRYAAAAHRVATRRAMEISNKTAAGEASAKVGFNAEVIGLPPSEVDSWFTRSYKELAKNDDRWSHRERVATHILEGRALAIRSLGQTAIERSETSKRSAQTFAAGHTIVKEQHQRGQKWDPYATMLARHRATNEAVNGRAYLAAAYALAGIYLAIRSDRETANSPSGFIQHTKFIGKQAVSNALAGVLASTKPLNFVIKNQRERMARWMLV